MGMDFIPLLPRLEFVRYKHQPGICKLLACSLEVDLLSIMSSSKLVRVGNSLGGKKLISLDGNFDTFLSTGKPENFSLYYNLEGFS